MTVTKNSQLTFNFDAGDADAGIKIKCVTDDKSQPQLDILISKSLSDATYVIIGTCEKIILTEPDNSTDWGNSTNLSHYSYVQLKELA